jgi:predicted DNA-binding protein
MSKTKKLEELKRDFEKRSERIQILLTPSQLERLKEIKSETGASVSEIFNRAIESYLEDI